MTGHRSARRYLLFVSRLEHEGGDGVLELPNPGQAGLALAS
jgi:hypothetical protein